jgi:hypothetical protein
MEVFLKGSILVLGLMLTSVSCSMLGPKPHTAYTRPDIQRPVEKLVVFPVTNFEGVQDDIARKAEVSFTGKWAELYGKENVVPGGQVVFKLMEQMGKETYGKFISSLDNVSALEQLHKDPKVREFLSTLSKQFGGYHFALAIINGSQQSYESKSPVNVHIGLFDSQNLTWKWITKIQDKKGIFGNWAASTQVMVSNSFDLIKELEDVKGRKVASENK